jgi:hypothetical protein
LTRGKRGTQHDGGERDVLEPPIAVDPTGVADAAEERQVFGGQVGDECDAEKDHRVPGRAMLASNLSEMSADAFDRRRKCLHHTQPLVVTQSSSASDSPDPNCSDDRWLDAAQPLSRLCVLLLIEYIC